MSSASPNLPETLQVSVAVDSSGVITATPDTLQVPNGFDGTITWTLTGATFLNPALTFEGETPPSFELSLLNTATTRVRRWGNFLMCGPDSLSYYYTVHAALPTGERVEHDPTVENEPPPTGTPR